jgi:hypothetical protein
MKTSEIILNDADAKVSTTGSIRIVGKRKALVVVPFSGLGGTLNGKLDLWGAIAGHKTNKTSINFNAANNTDDVHTVSFEYPFDTIEYSYAPGGITGASAKFSIIVGYEENV